jgi:hypothetical protein
MPRGAKFGNKNSVGNKGGKGNPAPKYSNTFVRIARVFAAQGMLEYKMAEAFGVAPRTLRDWKTRHLDFRAACYVTEAEKLESMKFSLYHRGIGYSHETVKIVTVAIGNGMSEIVKVPFIEHYPPDVAAMRYYLNNKSAGEYKDRAETEQVGAITVRVHGGLPDVEVEPQLTGPKAVERVKED